MIHPAFPLALAGAWINATIICYVIHLVRSEGLTTNLGTAIRRMWPLMRGLIVFVVPTAIAFLLLQSTNGLETAMKFAGFAGIPGVFMADRAFISRVSDVRRWRTLQSAILAAFLTAALIPLAVNS